jgi:hypothetical protein
MIARCFSTILAALAVTAVTYGFALPARAALESDPVVLYQKMKAAYDRAAAASWDFQDQEIYLSTIFDAGRAYALQRPDDPTLAELETLTVQIGAGLHYNPLTNHDAATWYVRAAAVWVSRNSSDPGLIAQANALLDRVNSEDPAALARLADDDAIANAAKYPADVDTQLQAVEANWRAWLLTGDRAWRSLAFQKVAQANFPLAHLPSTYGPELLRAVELAQSATAGGYTPEDRVNAGIIEHRLKALTLPPVIATVHAMPHDAYLTTLAPADEYFGDMGYSVLGIENELKHINFMLDYNYGNREAAQTVLVAQSIDDMHKVYPRDRDMAKLLYSCLTTLERMDSDDAKAAMGHLRWILTVEYQDSPEARKVLTPPAS